MIRRPQTTQERRMSFKVDDLEPEVRTKRNYKNLPNAWDDKNIASWYDKNWKKYRKTKYKTKRGHYE